MAEINVDTRGSVALTLGVAEVRTEQDSTAPKTDRASGKPLFRLPVVFVGRGGRGELVQVTVPGDPGIPAFSQVEFAELRIMAWAQNGRSGNAWRADSVAPVGGPVVDPDGKPTVPLPVPSPRGPGAGAGTGGSAGKSGQG